MTRRYVKDKTIEALLKKHIEPPTPSAIVEKVDLSIDGLLAEGLHVINRVMQLVKQEAYNGSASREAVMNLRDIMHMLQALKEKEASLIDDMSDEDLAKVAGKLDDEDADS